MAKACGRALDVYDIVESYQGHQTRELAPDFSLESQVEVSSGHRIMKRNKNYTGQDSDDDYMAEEQAPGRNNGGRTARRTAVAQTPRSAGRSRPTNNQLLYKAYFRWTHYGHKMRNGTTHLPTETDACPSVTAAFLQVLHTLNLAEGFKVSEQRNILQILSNNTRRTKVVELSTGTHRVPDELRKHYLSDGEGGQYSTNLDRNRYGNDDQYLFTVIRYDLEFLGLCPCMVDVEIIDAKNDNQSIFVSAGQEACVCTKFPGMLHDPGYAMQQFATRSRGAMPAVPGAAEAMPGASQGQPASPKRSGSQASLAFDALVMAATGGTEGAAAAAAGGEAPVESRLGGPLAAAAAALTPGVTPGSSSMGAGAAVAAAAAAMAAASVGRSGGTAMHQLPSRQRSRLWSALSYGDVDSLQNALDAFRAEDEIASGPGLSDALAGAVAAAGAAPQPSTSESYRRRQRKPMRGPSSNNILAQSVDMLAGMSSVDRNILNSLVKGTGVASGLRELSGDNAGQADVISSGAVQGGTARRTSSGPGRSAGSQGARGAASSGQQPVQQQRRSFRTGDQDEQLSQEDDSEPVTGNRSGARKAGSGVDAASEGLEELGAAAAEAGENEGAIVGDVGIADSMLPGAAGEGVGDAGEADIGDDDADAVTAGMDGPPLNPLARRVRHVPRQSSAVNLGTRVGPAELKRMAAEVEVLKAENRMLRQAAGAAAVAAGLMDDDDDVVAAAAGGGSKVALLEREVAALRQQVNELLRGKRAADEKVLQLNQELLQTRNTANQVLHHALMKEASALNPSAAAAALGGLSRPGNGLGGSFGGSGGPQGGLPFNPLAALASGQLHTLLAGAHNPAAAAALAAAAMAAAAATGNPVGGFDQQLIRSSGNLPEEVGHFGDAEQEQQQQQLPHYQQQQQQSPQEAAATMQAAAAAAIAAAAAAAAAGAPPAGQALGRDMVSESVADAEVDQAPGSAAAVGGTAAAAGGAGHVPAAAAAAVGGDLSDDIKAAADAGFTAEQDSKPSSAAAATGSDADLAPAGMSDTAADADTTAALQAKQESPAVGAAAADPSGTAPPPAESCGQQLSQPVVTAAPVTSRAAECKGPYQAKLAGLLPV